MSPLLKPPAVAVDKAYGVARSFLEELHGSSRWARGRGRQPGKKGWKSGAGHFAQMFVALHDLRPLVTPQVIAAASRVYPPSHPGVRIRASRPYRSMIEAVRESLAPYIKHVHYPGAASPLAALKIKPSWVDAVILMEKEWMKIPAERVETVLSIHRLDKVDVDELLVQLDREFHGVAAQVGSVASPEGDDNAATAKTISSLTISEQRLWGYLKGGLLSRNQLADQEHLDTSCQTVAGHVQAIRGALGKDVIRTKRGRGYWRPDAPPDWDSLPPVRKRKRRISTR